MQTFNQMKKIITYALAAGILFGLSNCKKETEPIFEVNQVKLYPSASSKLKEKTESQWIAVLYTNLFQQAL